MEPNGHKLPQRLSGEMLLWPSLDLQELRYLVSPSLLQYDLCRSLPDNKKAAIKRDFCFSFPSLFNGGGLLPSRGLPRKGSCPIFFNRARPGRENEARYCCPWGRSLLGTFLPNAPWDVRHKHERERLPPCKHPSPLFLSCLFFHGCLPLTFPFASCSLWEEPPWPPRSWPA